MLSAGPKLIAPASLKALDLPSKGAQDRAATEPKQFSSRRQGRRRTFTETGIEMIKQKLFKLGMVAAVIAVVVEALGAGAKW